MRAIVITKPGGPDVLQLDELPDIQPQRGEVRVRVRATAVNRADVLQRQGRYPAPVDCPANIPGLEYAGEIDAIGEGTTDLRIGDRVFGLVGGGSYSEHIVAHWRTVARMPEGLSFEEATALPEACLTAYDAIILQCKLSPGETVLINPAASGVGTAAVQIARAIGAITFGTTRTSEKMERIFELGLEHGIVCPDGKFAEKVMTMTDKRGVNVVLDLIGGNYINEDMKCLAMKGRLIVVGLLGGTKADLDLAQLLMRRLEVRGTTLRARPLEEKIAAAQVLTHNIVPMIEKGHVRPIIDKIFKLEQIDEAHAYMESNRSFGKIVITV
ncbi:MAG TPA: NAD(P)H-quinone oxidoreductase [Planktothrix sp.]|jgi:putative PIG3 family NAD(P)H quinone oxidoreductase